MNADFLISAILAGLFFFTQIQPYILSSDHLFVFISYIVVFVGAAVGGILGTFLRAHLRTSLISPSQVCYCLSCRED